MGCFLFVVDVVVVVVWCDLFVVDAFCFVVCLGVVAFSPSCFGSCALLVVVAFVVFVFVRCVSLCVFCLRLCVVFLLLCVFVSLVFPCSSCVCVPPIVYGRCGLFCCCVCCCVIVCSCFVLLFACDIPMFVVGLVSCCCMRGC